MGRTAQRLGIEQTTQPSGGRTAQRLGVVEPRQSSQPEDRSGVANFALGAGKGALSTVTGLSGIGEKIGRGITGGRVEDFLFGKKQDKTIAEQLIPETARTPLGTAQKAGFVTEQIGEFFVPMSKVAKIDKAIDVAVTGSKVLQGSGVASGLVKAGAKALTEAGAGGALTYAQTGDMDEAKKSALLFGGTKAVTGAIGQALKAFGVPEKLYTRIFKNNYKDMIGELKAKGIATFAKTHPEQYGEFLKNGVIKTGLGGKKVINESLAKQALDRGLKGSLRNMSDTVVEDTLVLEDSARKIAKNSNKIIGFKNADRLAGVLKETAEKYANVGNGSVSRTALKFSSKLAAGGKINAEESLRLRRFLDGMRIRSSFDPNAGLSMSQQNFKYWADITRAKLAKVPGMQKTMEDYAFNIEALEALAREASRRGNSQVVGLIDSIFLGASAIEPTTAATIGFIRKTLNSPSALTKIGSAMERTGNLTKPGALVKSGINRMIRE